MESNCRGWITSTENWALFAHEWLNTLVWKTDDLVNTSWTLSSRWSRRCSSDAVTVQLRYRLWYGSYIQILKYFLMTLENFWSPKGSPTVGQLGNVPRTSYRGNKWVNRYTRPIEAVIIITIWAEWKLFWFLWNCTLRSLLQLCHLDFVNHLRVEDQLTSCNRKF